MSKTIIIGGKEIGDSLPTYVVAEIGLNHNGRLETAIKLIDKAKECGADAVKFQKRDLQAIYKEDILKDPNKDSQATVYLFNIFKRFELSKSDFRKIKKYCDKIGITFFCTPFDLISAEFLEELNVPFYKVSSADLTNMVLISKLVSFKKPMILSTGMSEISEIDFTVNFLKKKKVTFSLMHCISSYPPSFKDINLKMIDILKKRYDVPVGYSGHERGITISECAVALGANILERHFTLDRSMEGPDHNISLEPEGLLKMINRIRIVEQAIGTGEKTITRGELLSREAFAKSLISKRDIKKGEKITEEMVDFKVPGKGLSVQMLSKILNKRAKREIKKFDYFNVSDI